MHQGLIVSPRQARPANTAQNAIEGLLHEAGFVRESNIRNHEVRSRVSSNDLMHLFAPVVITEHHPAILGAPHLQDFTRAARLSQLLFPRHRVLHELGAPLFFIGKEALNEERVLTVSKGQLRKRAFLGVPALQEFHGHIEGGSHLQIQGVCEGDATPTAGHEEFGRGVLARPAKAYEANYFLHGCSFIVRLIIRYPPKKNKPRPRLFPKGHG